MAHAQALFNMSSACISALVAYDESGNAKDVTFETSKVLTDGAYLCLKVAPIRGVVTWAEMQFDELPSSVQEKYKE